MFMGFAGYGIGGKSRYDHDMITEHIYVFDMIMNIIHNHHNKYIYEHKLYV